MRQLLISLRRAPSTVIGVFVALVAAGALVTVVASLIGTAATLKAPVQRLAASPAVVVGDQHVRFTSGHGEDRETTSVALSTYRRVPVDARERLAQIPGVQTVVADVSIPLSLRTQANGLDGANDGGGDGGAATGHGWASAALTPMRLSSGHAPTAAHDLVLGLGLARSLQVGLGGQVRLSGQDLAPFTVVGLAAAPAGNPADGSAAFFTDDTARTMYGHPGQADLLAVLTEPGTTDDLSGPIKSALSGTGLTVLDGANRGNAEDVDSVGDKDDISGFALGAGIPVVLVSLFVVAGAVGLSVAGRRRTFALLRAVGATPGQVRRKVAGELAVLGVLGGTLGYPLGAAMARIAVSGMARHDLVPKTTTAWTAWFVALIACGAGLVVAQVSGFVAGWRAGRADPVLALQETNADRRRPNPVRLVLGLGALGGGITLAVFAFGQAHSPTDQMNLALTTLLALVAAIALLGPVLVSLGELLIRGPVHLLGGPSARLALADVRRRPQRIAAAMVAVALSVGFLGTVYLVNATALHADHSQSQDRLAADSVLAASGGLDPQAVTDAARVPGITTAVGVRPTTVAMPIDDGDSFSAAALSPGAVSQVLSLGVVSGRLDHIAPGEIALSQLVAGKHRVGSDLRVYLADGTAYHARVVAIFNRGMGFGDVVLPTNAAGGGHLGAPTVAQILVRGHASTGDMAELVRRFPGLHAQSSAAVNADAKQQDEQSSYLNTMIVVLIGLLAAVTLVNTLATATADRRDSLLLLRRVGTTSRQLIGMASWQALIVSAAGVVFGAAAGGTALLAVTKALTGSWHPYLPGPGLLALGTGVVALTAAAIIVPTAAVLKSARL